VLRIPRTGGEVRVFAYPRLDTIVWNGAEAPAPARVLAFDEEEGVISLVDAKGQPARIDFRQGAGSTVTKSKLTGLASNDGSTVYGITADGVVERYVTSGTWKWKPPVAARAVFPQPDASLLVLGERAGSSVVWKVRPPSTRIADSVVLPASTAHSARRWAISSSSPPSGAHRRAHAQHAAHGERGVRRAGGAPGGDARAATACSS
jgi:hypothetical protein